MLIVFTKDPCVQCKAVKRWLDKHGAVEGTDYELQDATKYLDYLADLGHTQAPVLYLSEENHWSGFQPDKLESWRASL